MKQLPGLVCIGILIALATATAWCGTVQPVSIEGSASPCASGGGDSGAAVISADGRYVLFSSPAANLTSSNAMPVSLTPKLNVYLRDRVNGTTRLVSVNLAGIGGNGDSLPAGISTNGQFALFVSDASDLVSNDFNNSSDVFVRDMINNTTVLVSAAMDGTSGNGKSENPVMTPDGYNVAFVSAATNLVSNDTNGIPDVFIRNLQTNATTMVSVGAQSPGSVSAMSDAPAITPDGRYVAFSSTATNLVPGVTTAAEIYVRDLNAGQTYWASTNALGILQSASGQATSISYDEQISADGQFVAFAAQPSTNATYQGVILRYSLLTGLTDVVATNSAAEVLEFEHDAQVLNMTPDGRFITFAATETNSSTSIYQWDAEAGTNILVSGDLNGVVTAGVSSDYPVQDTSGRFVVFFCSATNMTSDAQTNGIIYRRDMQAQTTELVDPDPTGAGTNYNPVASPGLSDDGSMVAFVSLDGNLVPNDSNHDHDVFVRDFTSETNDLVSVRDAALPSLTANGTSLLWGSSVSTNGRYVAFTSDADNVIASDTNGWRDVFVRDLVTGTNILVSADTNGLPAAGLSTAPTISGDGRYVAFLSYAANIVPGDTNNTTDVFRRDLQTGTTVLVSVDTNGGVAGASSLFPPVMSSDGRYVLFYPNSSSSTYTLYLRDVNSSISYQLTTAAPTPSPGSAVMTADGHYVAYIGASSDLFVWNSQTISWVYTNSITTFSNVSISPNGQYIAYLGGTPLTLHEGALLVNSNRQISAGTFPPRPGLQFSADGRYLVFATSATNDIYATNGMQNVYVHDALINTNRRISSSFASPMSADGNADSPSISPDGRYIAFRSYADNTFPGDTNGVPDVFLYDSVNQTTTLVSANQSGSTTADNRSLKPMFSGDGSTLLFQSAATDLTGGDFNQFSDIFAVNLTAPGTIDLTNSAAVLDPQIVLNDPLEQGSPTPNHQPLLIFTTTPGVSYQVQFTDQLENPVWQDLNGSVIFVGQNGYAYDWTPASGQRFYRFILGY